MHLISLSFIHNFVVISRNLCRDTLFRFCIASWKLKWKRKTNLKFNFMLQSFKGNKGRTLYFVDVFRFLFVYCGMVCTLFTVNMLVHLEIACNLRRTFSFPFLHFLFLFFSWLRRSICTFCYCLSSIQSYVDCFSPIMAIRNH